MFKNYEFTDEADVEQLKQDADIPESMLVKKQISAGWLIDQTDLKGTQIGDAKISDEHGNFIINPLYPSSFFSIKFKTFF